MTVNLTKQWPDASAVFAFDASDIWQREGNTCSDKRLAVSGCTKLTVLPESKRQSTERPLILIGAVDTASDTGLDWLRAAAEEIPGGGAAHDGGAFG